MKIIKYINNYLAKSLLVLALLCSMFSNVAFAQDTTDADTEDATNEIGQFVNAFTDWAIISFSTYSGQNEAELGSLFAQLKDQIKNNPELQDFITDITSDVDGFGSAMQAITNETGLKIYIQPQKVNNDEGFYVGVFNNFLAEAAKDPVAPYIIIKPVISGTKDTGYAITYSIETSETVKTDGYTLTEVSDKNPFDALAASGLDQKAMGSRLKSGLTDGLLGLSETIKSNFLPELYIEYAGDVIRPGDEIEVPMESGTSIELKLLEGGDVPSKTVTWTLDPDGDLAVSTLGVTKDRLVVPTDTVAGAWGITAATGKRSMSINLKVVNFSLDWKEVLKNILKEVINEAAEAARAKVEEAQADLESPEDLLDAYKDVLKEDGYSLSASLSDADYSSEIVDGYVILSDEDVEQYLSTEKKRTFFNNMGRFLLASADLALQLEIESFLNALLDDSGKLDEFVESIKSNSPDLVVGLATSVIQNPGETEELKQIVIDFINNRINEISTDE